MSVDAPRLMSLEKAAKTLGLSTSRLSRLAQKGRVESIIMSSGRSRFCQRFFRTTVIIEFKTKRETK